MTGNSRANRTLRDFARKGSTAALLIGLAGCRLPDTSAKVNRSPATLTMAFGLSTGQNPQSGARQAVIIVVDESLIGFDRDGRPQPRLAESWSLSSDGRVLHVQLRPGAKFHNGDAVTASIVRDILTRQLRSYLGSGASDIEQIRAPSPLDVEFTLKRRSSFILQGLSDVPIQAGELPGGIPNGTGPFKVLQLSEQGAEMVANDAYYGGRPTIDRIEVKPYASVRAAWADMLRGQADMLYEVGPDAIEILQPSKAVRVISHLRNYAVIGMLNVRRAALRDPSFRQALNASIDREALVSEILRGHGVPADGTVWPSNWAYDEHAPVFRYEPRGTGATRTPLTCVVGDVALERLALALQQHLQRIGVDLHCELMPVDAVLARVAKGDFDLFLADAQLGPTLLQSYRTWRTGAPRNLGGYSNPKVDAALDRVGAAANDDDYRAGVADFQRAIYDDPPAIFIAWSERARAVSTRFDVPVEPGRDILGTLRLWTPVADQMVASRN